MTLLEVMIVVTIFVLLVATLLPRVLPAIEARRTREAARVVHTALGAARSRAIETGRPAGVMFVRHQRKNNASIVLYQAEVPAPYSGGSMEATIVVSGTGPDFTGQISDPGYNPNLVKVGDRIRLNYQGPLFKITQPGATLKFRLITEADYGKLIFPWEEIQGEYRVPFQIYRQPVRSPGPPLVIPDQVAVDLGNSGPGLTNDYRIPPNGTNTGDLTVSFAADGSLDRIYHTNDEPDVETRTIHFLIGRRSKIDKSGTEGNLADLSNLWVSVGRSGLITSSPVASGSDARKYANEHRDAGGF